MFIYSVYLFIYFIIIFFIYLFLSWGGGGGGELGGTPIYGLYRYVPWDRVWFFRISVFKGGIIFKLGKYFPSFSAAVGKLHSIRHFLLDFLLIH